MRGVRKRDHVRIMTVNAAIGHQSDKMQPMSPRSGKRVMEDMVALQFAVSHRLVNPCQVLINDSAGSEIKMADLRVAHLSFRQANILSASAQSRPWIIAMELIVKWRRRQQRRVSITLSLLAATGIHAPAARNHEHYGTARTS